MIHSNMYDTCDTYGLNFNLNFTIHSVNYLTISSRLLSRYVRTLWLYRLWRIYILCDVMPLYGALYQYYKNSEQPYDIP